jgi:hypothetical protein
LVREPGAMEGSEQPITAPVPREHASGPVPPMGRWRQADHEHASAGVAEAGDRTPPIIPGPECRPFRSGDFFAVPDKAGTLAALDHVLRDAF